MKISIKLLLVFAGAVSLVVVQGLVDRWSSSRTRHDLTHLKNVVMQEAQAADGMMESVAKLESLLAIASSSTSPLQASQFRGQGAALFKEFHTNFDTATNASSAGLTFLSRTQNNAEYRTGLEQYSRLKSLKDTLARVETNWAKSADLMDAAPAQAEAFREKYITPALTREMRPLLTEYDQDLEKEMVHEVENASDQTQQSQRFILIIAALMGCIILAATIYAARMVLVPLKQFEKVANAVAEGNHDSRLAMKRSDEFGVVAKTFDLMLDTLQATTISRDDLEKKVAERTDELALEAKARQAAHAELDRFFALSRDAMCIEDYDGKLLRVNAGYAEKLGYTAGEFLSLTPDKRIYQDDMPLFRSSLDLLVSGKQDSVSFDLRGRKKDGSTCIFSWRLFIAREVNLIYASGRDVTERRQMLAALRERETMLRHLTDNLPNGATYRMITTADGRHYFQHISESIERLAGVKAEVIRADAGALFSLILEKDRQRADAISDAAQSALKQFDCQTRIRTAAGEVRWIHWRSLPQPLPSGDTAWDGLIVDITPLKFAESELWRLNEDLEATVRERNAALVESERRLRTLLANLQGMAYRCRNDQNWTMEFMSEGCRALLGIRPEAFVAGQVSYANIIHPDDRERVQAEIQEAIANKIPFKLEYRVKHSSGKWLDVWEQGRAVFDEHDQVVALEGFVTDITERVAADKSRRSLEDQLRQAQKLEAIGTLAGGIAHDFNNILAAIMGSAELVKMDITKDHPSYEFMEQILLAGNRARGLVQQILTFSKRSETSLMLINLRTVVKECLKLLRATIPPMVEIHSDISTSAPPILADPTQMHQIIMNLCTNAWHALPVRNGRIDVKLEPYEVDDITASTNTDLCAGSYVRLSVRDNGCGMDKATLERIFEPFFTTKASGKGTGLGLSVVHGIVKAHKGAIVVDSQPGQGTAFYIYFPAEKGVAPESFSESKKIFRGNNERVLLVDDEELPGRTVEQLIRRLGYQVKRFTDSNQAMLDFISSPQKYDLVITDHAMPGMSGNDLAKALLKARPSIPVMIITGMADPGIQAEARQLGVRSVLMKPVTAETLAQEVARFVNHSEENEYAEME